MDNAVSSRFDLNGDGTVDLKDLAYAAKVAGVTVTSADCAVALRWLHGIGEGARFLCRQDCHPNSGNEAT